MTRLFSPFVNHTTLDTMERQTIVTVIVTFADLLNMCDVATCRTSQHIYSTHMVMNGTLETIAYLSRSLHDVHTWRTDDNADLVLLGNYFGDQQQ